MSNLYYLYSSTTHNLKATKEPIIDDLNRVMS